MKWDLPRQDGFFLTRDFSPFWLVLSEVLRRARAERALPWLPGISKDPAGSPILVVNQGVGRRILPGLLHLLGYRKDSEDGNRQTFIKQGSPRSSPRR